LLEGDFPGLAVADHGGGDLYHRLQFCRRVVGLGLLRETQGHTKHHHDQHQGPAGNVVRGIGQNGQDGQQNHQRVAHGEPEPVQPFALPFLRDLVRTEYFQPVSRLGLGQARGCGLQPLQHRGGFLRRRLAHQIGALIGSIFFGRHNLNLRWRNVSTR